MLAKDEFEFVTMGEKREDNSSKKIRYGSYGRFDFTYSKFVDIASVSVAPWVVKSVDFANKEVSFDTSVWPKNTGSLKLSDVATGDFFGQDQDTYHGYADDPCTDSACKNTQALTVMRERTAFTGATAYFIGRGGISYDTDFSYLWDASKNTTIFRVSENGTKEIVGKNIAAYLAKSSLPYLVHNFVYSPTDGKFYIIAIPPGGGWTLFYYVFIHFYFNGQRDMLASYI